MRLIRHREISSFPSSSFTKTLKHSLLWTHDNNMFLNVKVIISVVFKREDGVGRGKARKERLWGGNSGPEQGNLEAQCLFC